MSTTIVDEVATLLATNVSSLTVATSSGGNLFKIPLPVTAPDDAAHVIETGGQRSLRAFGSSIGSPVMDRTSLQVLLRGDRQGMADLRNLAEEVFENLDHFSGSVGGREIQYVRADPPLYIQQDESERHRFVVNVSAMHRRA